MELLASFRQNQKKKSSGFGPAARHSLRSNKVVVGEGVRAKMEPKNVDLEAAVTREEGQEYIKVLNNKGQHEERSADGLNGIINLKLKNEDNTLTLADPEASSSRKAARMRNGPLRQPSRPNVSSYDE